MQLHNEKCPLVEAHTQDCQSGCLWDETMPLWAQSLPQGGAIALTFASCLTLTPRIARSRTQTLQHDQSSELKLQEAQGRGYLLSCGAGASSSDSAQERAKYHRKRSSFIY